MDSRHIITSVSNQIKQAQQCPQRHAVPRGLNQPTPENPPQEPTPELLTTNTFPLAKHQLTLFATAAGNKVDVRVTEVTAFGDFTAALVDSFEASPAGPGGGESGHIEEAFLEVGEGPFRVLVVFEDDSAMMVGADGVRWVKEEALAAVDQVREWVLLVYRGVWQCCSGCHNSITMDAVGRLVRCI